MPVLLAVVAAVWLVRRVRLHWSWNPYNWWQDGTRAAGGALDTLKTWVLSEIQKAAALVWNDTLDVFNWVGGVFHDLNSFVNFGFGLINRSLSDLRGWAVAGLSWVANTARGLYNDAVGYARWVYDTAIHFGWQILSDAVHWAAVAVTAVHNFAQTIVDDAVHWAAVAIDTVSHYARVWVDDAVRWAEGAIADAWKSVYGAVKHDFIDPIEAVLNVVRKAWDWVWWFATHPFAVVHNVETDVIDWTEHLPEDVEALVLSGNFRKGVDAVGRFFGG